MSETETSPPQQQIVTQRRLHAVVSGRVQGVSYRYFTQQQANNLGVSGYVVNQPDGTVEVIAEGTPEQLRQFLNFLYKGSPAAQVERVVHDYSEATNEYLSFTIRYFILD
ncbi:MAG: acylphosphatase [Anaerolineae bacterium]|nr:acylphosphatase [Anaerolineae bacterium]